jgi:hypothetical protein
MKKGFFAKKDYKKDEQILKFDDSQILWDKSELDTLKKKGVLEYFPKGKVIILQPPECYIAHSSEPNSYIKIENKIRTLYATRQIKKDEEITRNKKKVIYS